MALTDRSSLFVCVAAILEKTADRQALAKALVTFCDLCSPGTHFGNRWVYFDFWVDSHLEKEQLIG